MPTTMIMAPSVNDVAVGSEAVIVQVRAICDEEGDCCDRGLKPGSQQARGSAEVLK